MLRKVQLLVLAFILHGMGANLKQMPSNSFSFQIVAARLWLGHKHLPLHQNGNTSDAAEDLPLQDKPLHLALHPSFLWSPDSLHSPLIEARKAPPTPVRWKYILWIQSVGHSRAGPDA